MTPRHANIAQALGVPAGESSGAFTPERKARPILFSGPMVRALLDGRKTQTRRLITCANSSASGCRARSFWKRLDWTSPKIYADHSGRKYPWYLHVPMPDDGTVHRVRPEIEPGDVLWVRESVCEMDLDHRPPRWAYKADQPIGIDGKPDADSERCRKDYGYKWKPSIHMPRLACRLYLEVVSVRVERAQDITDADIAAEGIVPFVMTAGGKSVTWYGLPGWDEFGTTPREAWLMLLENVGRAQAWHNNDWMWVVEFKRTEAP